MAKTDSSNSSTQALAASSSKDNYSLSTLEEDILSVLSHRKSYGLEISKAIEQASSGRRVIGVGSLYPSLKRLEKKGFTKSEWEGGDNERRGARRRYYSITKTGAKILADNQEVRRNLLTWQPA